MREENHEKVKDNPTKITEITTERLQPLIPIGQTSNIFAPSFLSAGNPLEIPNVPNIYGGLNFVPTLQFCNLGPNQYGNSFGSVAGYQNWPQLGFPFFGFNS